MRFSSGHVQFSPLPVQFQSGSGTVTAQLRLGAKLAFDFHALGEGFTLQSGIFTDVPTYSAAITFDPKSSCKVALTEHLAVDAGVFASAAATVDFVNFGAGPKFVTTFATLSLPGACLASSTAAASNYTITRWSNSSITSAPAVLASSTPVSKTVLTAPFVPSSLATPIIGPYIAGTPVVRATSIGSVSH
jgi:hypothetical protein